MRAGSLRHKVTIQRNTPTEGDYGEDVDVWATLLIVWASIRPDTGKEGLSEGRIDATVTHTIRMRYTDITPEDRIVYGSRTFNISSIQNVVERDRELHILAVEDV